MSWEIPELGPLVDTPASSLRDEIGTIGGEPMYWGRDGQPMTLRQWVTGCSSEEYSILGRTEIGDVTVVTAWIGVAEHFFDTTENKLIYGTIELRHGRALITTGQAFSNEVLSSSEADAKAEHERRVAALRATREARSRSARRGRPMKWRTS